MSHVYFVSWTGMRLVHAASSNPVEVKGNGEITMSLPITSIKHIRNIEAYCADQLDLEWVYLINYQLLRVGPGTTKIAGTFELVHTPPSEKGI